MTTRPRGKICVETKWAMREERLPWGWPGKARFMLTWSKGETRWLARQALSESWGIRITRPWSDAGSRSQQRRLTAIWPSYSLPWVPPNTSTPFGGWSNVPPSVPLMIVRGTSE